MAVDKELLERDLYGLLGIGEKASEKEVKTAFRQKALTCHPDKNPDNPRAAEIFHQLSQALAVLTDAAARAAYDRVRRAKKEAAARTQKLDEKRKKVKLDLEAREREAQSQENEEEEIRITRSLEEEIIRLREEGSRQLEEQQRLVREQIRLEKEQHSRGKQERNGAEGKITPKLKLRWKCRKEDETAGGYSKDVLLQILQKYGDVLNLLISSRKTGSAVVEFATVKAAEMAVKNEVGLLNNPLKISWLEGQPRSHPSTVLPDSTSLPRSSQSVAVLVQDDDLVAQLFVPPEGEASEEGGGLEGPPAPSIHGEERQRGAGMLAPHRQEPRDQQRATQQDQPLPALFPELQGTQRGW
ncbi:dnaJ homolog subfamily C member 17 isoform X1 [Serinus canaria]|uniref:dnaJ homolog subfamily C member 17 isoform X1 n=1 Tax=Serinus canaria TaxID=9135 RepID=UPI0021CCCB2A|nr:dnaJ homolog subfamily C member 17 isoform X1 [Serinus canaria]